MRALLLGLALLGAAQEKKDPGPPLLLEAEDFQPGAGWERKPYGANYYVGTFANTFLSRKAFLGAPAQGPHAEAILDVEIPAAGRYLALVRYEAAYRFETRFRLLVEQNGRFKLDRLYGSRENPKIWAFGKKLQKEVAWDWGATENIVWEGHDAAVELEAGPARLRLQADAQPEPAARRNVDAILLTRDEEDVRRRIESENYLPLDGLLTQAGDVFLRVRNLGGGGAVTVHPAVEHSPYWVHRRRWAPKTIEPRSGETTDWIEVGHLLDSLNDGQWKIALPAKGFCDLEFATRSKAGVMQTFATFQKLNGELTLAYDADLRETRRLRRVEEILHDLVAELRKDTVRGEPPKRTLVYATTFDPRPNDAAYTRDLAEFRRLMGVTAWLGPGADDVSPEGLVRGYIDVRGQDARKLREAAEKLKVDRRADKIAVVSLGDEIGLPVPAGGDHEGFQAWAKERGLKPSQLEPAAGENWSKVRYDRRDRDFPARFYYSNLYAHRHGINAIRELTDALRPALPNAGIGANFSPHHGEPYLGLTHQWVSLFREGGMTMPWSEDYIFQMPVGTQQMNFLSLDLFRAGVKGNEKAKIHFYVMPHWPGNSPEAWRRQFYGAIAHGAKVLNLFEFRPVQAAYTENHCSHPSMYREVRRSLHELGLFEDVVQEGQVQPGLAALWFSETGDIWGDSAPPFAAAKRSLYIAARHLQLPLDVAVCGADLDGKSILFLADRHVSRADASAIADWVERGGRLLATAGAGMLDEFNEPNEPMRRLLGIEETGLVVGPGPIRLEKQDLPFAEAVQTVFWNDSAIPAFGAIARIEAKGAEVTGQFEDRSPAVTVRKVGRGRAVACAFLPGLSYFQRAIPRRPVDRGHAPETMAQLIPTAFDRGASGLLKSVADVEIPILSTEPLVETTLIRSPSAALIPLVNWSAGPLRNLMVIVRGKLPSETVTLATGTPVRAIREKEGLVLTFDLDVADALILRNPK